MEEKTKRWAFELAKWGLVLGLVSLAALLSSPAGYRAGLFGHRTAFKIMEFAAYGGVSGVIIAAAGLIWALKKPGRARLLALSGVIAGFFAFYIPWSLLSGAREFPPINDITTDMDSPPEFVSLVEARKAYGSRVDYPGADMAGKQAASYPGIRPLIMDMGADAAFDRALSAAKEMGWEISASDKTARRIEATDTTFWFGFRDDIVIRLTPAESRTRLDVRSASRVGKGDAGKNAERIREYLGKVER
ncbi:MAG TPA: DUF1499 domain-containing protein [Thermodesulfobacteriota bacterium]